MILKAIANQGKAAAFWRMGRPVETDRDIAIRAPGG